MENFIFCAVLLLKWDMELPSYYRNHFHVKQLSFEVVKCVVTSSILKILMVLKNNYTKKILDLFAIFKAIRAFVLITRSSHQKCSIEIVVLKNFTKFTGIQLCLSLFFNNVADLRPAILEILAQVFSCEFCEIFYNIFLQNTSGLLLLYQIDTSQLICTVNDVSSFCMVRILSSKCYFLTPLKLFIETNQLIQNIK